MTGYTILWLIIFVVLVIAEFATLQLVSVWFALGALVSMICSFFGVPFSIQLILFVVVSAVLLILTRPFINKFLKNKIVATNSELDIGKTAQVIQAINNNKFTGRVKLNGVDWSAVSSDGEDIDEGTTVVIDKVQGSKLFVSIEK